MVIDDSRAPTSLSGVLSGLRLDELLGEVQQRSAEIVATRDRMQRLLDAVLAVATGWYGRRSATRCGTAGRRR